MDTTKYTMQKARHCLKVICVCLGQSVASSNTPFFWYESGFSSDLQTHHSKRDQRPSVQAPVTQVHRMDIWAHPRLPLWLVLSRQLWGKLCAGDSGIQQWHASECFLLKVEDSNVFSYLFILLFNHANFKLMWSFIRSFLWKINAWWSICIHYCL